MVFGRQRMLVVEWSPDAVGPSDDESGRVVAVTEVAGGASLPCACTAVKATQAAAVQCSVLKQRGSLTVVYSRHACRAAAEYPGDFAVLARMRLPR